MKNVDLIATRYAKAIYEIAQEKKEVKTVYEILSFFLNLYDNDKEFKNFINNPLIEYNTKKKVLENILDVDDFIKNIVFYILSKNRFNYIKNIVNEYSKLFYINNKILNIKATFTRELTRIEEENLKNHLERRTGKKVHLNINVDKSILGGGIIKIGDQIIDGSLKNELNKLRYKNH